MREWGCGGGEYRGMRGVGVCRERRQRYEGSGGVEEVNTEV